LPSPALAAALFLLLHFAIGVSGAWRFAKEEAVSDAGALIAAGAFGACGVAVGLLESLRRLGLPAVDRRAGPIGPADESNADRSGGGHRPAGHDGQPR